MHTESAYPKIPFTSLSQVAKQRTRLWALVSEEYWRICKKETKGLLQLLSPHASLLQKPLRVLDIGGGLCGYARILSESIRIADLYILDTDNEDKDIALGFKAQSECYNSFKTTRQILQCPTLQARCLHLVDYKTDDLVSFRNSNIGCFDLVLSLWSWCFHYPFNVYAQLAQDVLSEDGLLVLDIRDESDKYGESELALIASEFEVVDNIPSSNKSRRLVLRKKRGIRFERNMTSHKTEQADTAKALAPSDSVDEFCLPPLNISQQAFDKALELLYPKHITHVERQPLTLALECLHSELLKLISPQIIIEAGAFEGDFALAESLHHPNAKVIALEANPDVWKHFQARFTSSNVEYLNLAVSSSDDDITIYSPRLIKGTQMPVIGRMSSAAGLPFNDSEGVEYSVSGVRLESIISKYAQETGPISVWIDVEGFAYDALIGCGRYLDSGVSSIFVELETSDVWKDQKNSEHVRNLLARQDFISVARDCQKWFQHNEIFLKHSLHEEIHLEIASKVNQYYLDAVESSHLHCGAPIIQYWDLLGNMPNEVKSNVQNWKDFSIANEAKYNHLLFSYDDVLGIANAFGMTAQIRALEMLKDDYPAKQADLARYLLLYLFGGLYIDVDTRPIGDITSLLCGHEHLIMDRRGNVANDLMYCRRPFSKLAGYCMNVATHNITHSLGSNAWEQTGPGIMTRLREVNPEHPIFKEVTIISHTNAKQFVMFDWEMSYKKSSRHWTNELKDDH